MATSYTVTAPLAIVRNSEQGGRQEYLYQGSPVPSYVSDEEIKRLVEDGFVSKQDDAESAGVTPATSPDQLNTDVLVDGGKTSTRSTSTTKSTS